MRLKSLALILVSALLAGMLAACSPLPASGKGEFTLEEAVTVEVDASKKLELVNTTSEKTVIWESDDETIAKVSRTGTVTGMKVGETVVSASAGGYYQECKVTVTDDKDAEPDAPVDPDAVIPADGAIGSVAQLRSIGSNAGLLRRNYYLTQDIDFAGGDMETIGTWDVPSATYSGIFDGKGFAIMNVTFTGGSANKNTNRDGATFGNAMFSMLSGTVKNLNLINVKAQGDGFCGAIAGKNSGKIENCYVGGSLTRIACANGWLWWVPGGGLAAINDADTGMIESCLYNGPEVTGGYALVGWNFGTAKDCYAALDRYPAETDEESLILPEGEVILEGEGVAAGPSSCAFLSDSQLKAPASYVGFSSAVWEMIDGKMAYLKGAGERGWAVF
ncbi:MAG: Ig-like domain-containing protein [Clostridiales bacterium]|nr:Ig-like domain-containing protein [Clostridiales bacterium]